MYSHTVVSLFVVGLVSLVLAQRPVPVPQPQPQPILENDPRFLNVDPRLGNNRQGFFRQPTINNNGQLSPSGAAVTLRSENENSGDGTFRWGFETSDGIKQEAMGYVKEPRSGDEGPIQVIQGSYSYISPEGIPITVNYIADELGFRAVGDHIPTAPPALQHPIRTAVDPLIRNPARPEDRELLAQDLLNRNPAAPYNPYRQQLGRPNFDRQYNNNRFSPYNDDIRYNQRFQNQNQLAGAPVPVVN